MSKTDVLQRAARKVDGYLQGLAEGSEILSQKREISEEESKLLKKTKASDLLKGLTREEREYAFSYLLGLADAAKEAKENEQ